MVPGEVAITVTREEQHQDVIAHYAPAPGRERRVAVELTWCVVPAGKYKGQQAIEVRLDGHRVGELTYLMSQRYAPLVTNVNAHGGRAGCEAVIERDARGLQLTLRLPRDADAVPAEPPTVVIPAAATASQSTFTKHRKAWIAAGAVVAVLFFAAIANGDEEPAASPPPSDETTTTVADLPTTTPTTTTTPPPTTTTTTTTVAQPPPTTEQPAPPPATDPAPQRECDPNYSGCVPIASDVDCAGGSGNGPEYVAGPIRVIGDDIYDLDRNSDGIACE